jgi:hypothetical protein
MSSAEYEKLRLKEVETALNLLKKIELVARRFPQKQRLSNLFADKVLISSLYRIFAS